MKCLFGEFLSIDTGPNFGLPQKLFWEKFLSCLFVLVSVLRCVRELIKCDVLRILCRRKSFVKRNRLILQKYTTKPDDSF